MDTKKYYYSFDRLHSLLEGYSNYRLSATMGIVGYRTPGVLGLVLGISAKRHYPFGYVVVGSNPTRRAFPSDIATEVAEVEPPVALY